MEGWERPPHRRSRSKNASFSSSLLDAIYRSIDDDDVDNSKSGETRGGVPDRSFSHRKQVEPVTHSRNGSRAPVVSELAVSRAGVTDYYRRSPCGVGTFAPTSSSSSSSSSSITPRINATGLFSSSDGESNQSDRIPRLDSPATKKKAKPKCSNLRSGLRGLRKPRTTSDAAAATSPRERLVRFIIALFSAAGSSRKPKITVPSAAAAKDGARTEESTTTSTSASSCMGTCLSKASEASRRQAAGAEKGKRTVRFYPANVIVDEDYSRPCGHKRLQDGAANAAARVKELLRPGREEEEEDDDAGGSESSSDLFELENLTEVMGEGRGGGRCRDELPLYETTNLNKNRAIARGLIL
ncbi:protein BIG GRAIN 1-like A [Musa acuminata AAA Group]|uniref:protein BIG GRAIN 1-like A n=1 Tax=Musa acuminata AAA Group TaxID=214697 RepID=UPI0031E14B40